MTPVIIADDLSGAMEVAAVFHRNGWRSILPLSPTPIAKATSHDRELQVISTETRNETPIAAQRVISALLASLYTTNCGLLFKKIDSTMRGPVGAELTALCATYPNNPVFITPANPIVGRTVRDGILHVNGARVTTTAFRNDPGSPVLHDDLASLIATSCVHNTPDPWQTPVLFPITLPLATLRSDPNDCAAFIRNHMRAGSFLFACDAETTDDLDALVQAAYHATEQPVLVGSGALAASLAALMSGRSKTEKRPSDCAGATLFACGSMHPLSRRQMHQLDMPVNTLPFDAEAARSVVQTIADEITRNGQSAFVLQPDQPVSAAQWLEATTRAVAAIHERRPLRALFVTGGETARAVCQRLGGTSLELCGEIEQGVAAAHLETPHGRILVITKPGGFGDDHTLQRVQQWLASAR